MARIFIKNWGSFQHYKGRRPPWIKLHRELLDNYEYHCLPLASKALAPLLWLLASDSEDGSIEYDLSMLAFRFRLTEDDIKQALTPLTESGFIEIEQCQQDASTPLAPCKQELSLDKRREEERERQSRNTPDSLSQAVATELRISDHWVKSSISEQIRLAMESGADGQEVAERMIDAGRKHRGSKEFKFGEWKKYFSTDHWSTGSSPPDEKLPNVNELKAKQRRDAALAGG